MSDADAFTTVWQTLNLDKTAVVDHVKTIVPSEDEGRRLDFSLITLPTLTATGAAESGAPQLELGPTIGQGGMALVHLARQVALGRDVAVKVLRDEMRSPESVRVLLSEAWITGLLQHPNIIPVYELGQDAQGSPLLVMKCIGGIAWREFLRHPEEHASTFGKLTPLEWHLGILMQVANAIGYAHSKGIVHRDLKPDNVMIGEFGEVYVLDWGLAVSVDDTSGRFRRAADIDAIAGTPGYMAPEMVDFASRAISTHTDIYTLGAILHEILTGRPRHQGATLFDLLFSAYRSEDVRYGDDVPAELAAIANRAMHRDPAQRFADTEQLREAIQEFLRHRESAELANAAQARLTVLEQKIAAADRRPAAGTDILEIHRAYAEARFGFEQALRLWKDNATAIAGREAANRAMAELGAHLTQEKMQLEALKEFAQDSDVAIGARTRAIFAAVLAVLWGGLPFATAIVSRAGLIEVTWNLYIMQTASFGGILLIGLYFARRVFFATELNRKVASASLMIFIGVLVHRFYAWITGIDFPTALTQEMAIYFLALGLIAITIDRRLVWASATYLVMTFAAAFLPEYFYELHGLGNLLALTAIALAWR